MSTIPVVKKNQIKNEVITCIKEDGKEPENCLMTAAKMHHLSQRQVKEIADDLMADAQEDE